VDKRLPDKGRGSRTPLSVRSLSRNRSAERNNRQDYLTPVRMGGGNRKSVLGTSVKSASKTTTSRGSTIGGKSTNEVRPLQDKAYQQACVRKLLDFLRENYFHNDTLTSKHFPTSSKVFTEIFNFLYSFINPFKPEALQSSNQHENIIYILKTELSYTGQITKSNLMTMGSLHSWPSVLGCLSFLLENAKVNKKIRMNVVPIAYPSKDEQGFPIDRESKAKIKIEYHFTCYNKFNAGAEMHEMRDEDEHYRERLLENEEAGLGHLEDLQGELRNYDAKRGRFIRFKEIKAWQAKQEEDREKIADHIQKVHRKKEALERKKEHLQGVETEAKTVIEEKEAVLSNLHKEKSKLGMLFQGNNQLEVDLRRRIQQTEEQIKEQQAEKGRLEVQFYRIMAELQNVVRDLNSSFMEMGLKTDHEFMTLPLPEYVNGEVLIDPSVPLIKERLQDLEKEQKSLIHARNEELNEHSLNLEARHESLDQAKKKLVEYQGIQSELETSLQETKARSEKDEQELDRQLAKLKSFLLKLRSDWEEAREQLLKDKAAKGKQLEQKLAHIEHRRVEGDKFLREVSSMATNYLEEVKAKLDRSRERVKVWTEAKQAAKERVMRELTKMEAEIEQMMSGRR